MHYKDKQSKKIASIQQCLPQWVDTFFRIEMNTEYEHSLDQESAHLRLLVYSHSWHVISCTPYNSSLAEVVQPAYDLIFPVFWRCVCQF